MKTDRRAVRSHLHIKTVSKLQVITTVRPTFISILY